MHKTDDEIELRLQELRFDIDVRSVVSDWIMKPVANPHVTKHRL